MTSNKWKNNNHQNQYFSKRIKAQQMTNNKKSLTSMKMHAGLGKIYDEETINLMDWLRRTCAKF